MSRHRRSRSLNSEREGHSEARSVLRRVGFLLLSVGGVLLVIGLIDFFSALNGHMEPERFWMMMVALPVLGLGGVLLSVGYQRQIMQYQMRAAVPAVIEAFDDVASGTKDSVRLLAGAIGEGLRGDASSSTQACPLCSHVNSANAKFCDDCGMALAHTCPTCNVANDVDSKFCSSCGAKFA
jgi:hypothetical protein